MARTITESEHVNGAGEGVYVSTIYCQSRAEREAVNAAALRVVVPSAFQPGPKPGDPFDAFEGIPPNCDGDNRYVLAHAQHEAALDAEGCDSVACLITKGAND